MTDLTRRIESQALLKAVTSPRTFRSMIEAVKSGLENTSREKDDDLISPVVCTVFGNS
jgi:hypothetical protein